MATTPGADAEADSIAMTTTGVSEGKSLVRWGGGVRRMLRGEGGEGGEDRG